MHTDFASALFLLITFLFLAVILWYGAVLYLSRWLKAERRIMFQNNPVTILSGSAFISIALLLSNAISPVITLKSILSSQSASGSFSEILYPTGTFILIIAAVTFSCFFFSFLSTKLLANRSEIKSRINAGEVSYAILPALLFVGFSLLLGGFLRLFLEAALPYPEVPRMF